MYARIGSARPGSATTGLLYYPAAIAVSPTGSLLIATVIESSIMELTETAP